MPENEIYNYTPEANNAVAKSPQECRRVLKELGCCVIIPTYNNAGTLSQVISEVLQYSEDVIVVDDGSTDTTPEIIRSFGDAIKSLTQEKNQGKGVALLCGMVYAKRYGFKYAISIDSDGQHYPSDLPIFAESISKMPDTLIVGARNLRAEGMPGKNTFANRFSNFWYKLETGIRLDDTQSGYRAYPLDKIELGSRFLTGGYEFELEILVFSAWRGTNVVNVPIRVYYPPEGERVSHFKPFRDFTKISILNTILVLYCLLWRWPVNFFRKLTWKNCKSFIDRYIIHSPESNARIASAIALGVFMGVAPIWGYQMICAFALAHLLKLNKVITLVASNISLPPLIPFIIFAGYWVGCILFAKPVLLTPENITLASIGSMLLQYVVGSIVFGALLSVFSWCLSMSLLAIFRKSPDKPASNV